MFLWLSVSYILFYCINEVKTDGEDSAVDKNMQKVF